MGTEILHLQHELEQAKHSLKNVDEHLKKLIGRDPSELPPRVNKRLIPDDKNRPLLKNLNRGRTSFENEEPSSKRRTTSVFNRLSEKVPEVPQKGLISKVIVTPKEVPSREEALQAQNKDEKFKARNRRMFGALLGTLQKFQQEETKLKSREDKRAQLEKKIEEHAIKEKEEIRRERQELFLNRKKKQAEIKIIELKMLRMKEYNAWEESQTPRKSFITTKSKPHIHFLPRKLNDKTKELLASSKQDVERLIEKKKQQVTEELQHIEDRIKRNFDNRIMVKPDNAETGEQEAQETEDQLEDVITESQIAVANVSNRYKFNETKEECQQEVDITKPSEHCVANNTVEETINAVDTDISSEPLYEFQESVNLNEIPNEERTESNDSVPEKNEIVPENVQEEIEDN